MLQNSSLFTGYGMPPSGSAPDALDVAVANAWAAHESSTEAGHQLASHADAAVIPLQTVQPSAQALGLHGVAAAMYERGLERATRRLELEETLGPIVGNVAASAVTLAYSLTRVRMH